MRLAEVTIVCPYTVHYGMHYGFFIPVYTLHGIANKKSEQSACKVSILGWNTKENIMWKWTMPNTTIIMLPTVNMKNMAILCFISSKLKRDETLLKKSMEQSIAFPRFKKGIKLWTFNTSH